MGTDNTEDITAKLFALQDKAYADFQSKLLPTVKRETVIGGSCSFRTWIIGQRVTNYRLVALRSILKNYYRSFASG